jgi:hypothetical protein
VNHYRLQMPGGKEIERDIVERPESVLVLPVGQKTSASTSSACRKFGLFRSFFAR